MNKRTTVLRKIVIGIFAVAMITPAVSSAAKADHKRHGHGYWKKYDYRWAARKRHHRHWRRHHHRHDYYYYQPRRIVRHSAYPSQRYRQGSNNALVGGLIGAAIGAATGTQIGKGSGRTVAIIGGGLLGALIGGNLGRSMDRTDQYQVNQALETSRTGNTIAWRNTQTGGTYKVVPTKTYKVAENRYCREYTTWGVVGGYEEKLYGTACRQPDGSWKNVK
ncbi:MAG: glycine zipper 2TM domain-containing protein [Alphaproteobacteria bacterium]|nr:glycine zipper 2TM domain-containing protein [Alphaproteobacteria bacterium]